MSLEVARLPVRLDADYMATRPLDATETASPDYDALVQRFNSATATGLATIVPDGKRVDKDYLDATGFKRPLLVKSPAQLDLVVPAQGSMTLNELEAAISAEHAVRAIDVASQRELSSEMKLRDWMYYFKQPRAQRERVLNLISLESTGTRLDALVKPPKVVKEVGWVEKHWAAVSGNNAAVRKERALAPKVRLYCLMSAGGSYTEWHVDFGGSSVWYHLYQGRKFFFVIPPSDTNLDDFARWEGTYKHGNAPFFGDLVPRSDCAVIEMRAGDTMMLPSGWIHAVYTPEDSIAFGGNFLSGYHIPTHLRCHAKEKRQQIEGRFFFPEFECAVWYAAAYYAKMLSTCPSMLTKWEWQGLRVLVEVLDAWLAGKTHGLAGAPDPDVLSRVAWICKTAVRCTPVEMLKKMATAIETKQRVEPIEDDAREQHDTSQDALVKVNEEDKTTSISSMPPIQTAAMVSISRIATHDSSSSSSSSSEESSSDSSDSSSLLESSDGEDTGKESDHEPSGTGGGGGDNNGDTNDSSSDSSSDDDSSSSSGSDNEEESSKEVEEDKEEPQKEEEPEEFDEPEESSSDDSDNEFDPESAYPTLSPVPVDALIAIRKRTKDKELKITKQAKDQVIAMARQHLVERQKKSKKKKAASSNGGSVAVITPWGEDSHWVVACSCGLGGENYDDGHQMIECMNCKTWVHMGCVRIPIHDTFWCFKCRASDDWLFICPCGVHQKNYDDGIRMVQCNLCELWQHTHCGGIPDLEEPPEVYKCTECRKLEKKKRQRSGSQKNSKKASKKRATNAKAASTSNVPMVIPPVPVAPSSPHMDGGSSPPPPPPPPPSAPPSPDPSLYEEPTGSSTKSPENFPSPVQKRKRGRPPLKAKKAKELEVDHVGGPGSPAGVNGASMMMRPPLPLTPKSTTPSGKRKSGGSARDRLEKKLKTRKSRG